MHFEWWPDVGAVDYFPLEIMSKILNLLIFNNYFLTKHDLF